MASGELERDLRGVVEGEVRFSDGDRALWATDASNYRQVPIGVILPRHSEDVVRALEVCRNHAIPVLGRGGGTSLAGQCCNAAVVFDFSKYMNRILEIDAERRLARVQPGVVLDSLRNAAERFGLTFAPDPSTHTHCTLGGMIGNNSCGVHSVMGGKTDDNVEELEVLTYRGERFRVGRASREELDGIVHERDRRGEIYGELRALVDRYGEEIRARFPDIPRRVSGYNLDRLLPEHGFDVAKALVGSEGTCALWLESTVRLVPNPARRSLLVLGYPDVFTAADAAPEILSLSEPIGLEGIDDVLLGDIRKKGLHAEDADLLPDGRGWLLVEFGGDDEREAHDRARALMASLAKNGHGPTAKLYDRPEQEARVWEIRESGLGATARVPGQADAWEGWEDSAVPPERLGDYLRGLRGLMERYGYRGAFYGHFGQGCLHTRINFDLRTAEGIARFRSFVGDAAELVVSHGGSLSGEHGDGQSRAELLPVMFGHELVKAFGEFKAIWDPDGRMNPGKVVDADAITENLRLGASYRPWEPRTHFQFPDDEASFPRAAERCVGVGKCRRLGGGVMCPSYMVTLEEKHTTRGRAHALFEMMRGDPLERNWRERAVHEALELCLSCKGCKSDCPVNVDMATYKAEFYSHFYKGRLRPAAAYAMGLVFVWARLASKAPHLANAITHSPGVAPLLKRLGGVAAERAVPALAPRTFTAWFRDRGVPNPRAPDVLLWPDTFTNHFHPAIAAAAVHVLEAAGFRVRVPEVWLCCGRPLYDFGMLPTAKRMLRRILRELRPWIEAGTPMVGLEPSCVATFRDELVNLYPNDLDADRLSRQTFTLAEFLEERVEGLELPRLSRRALVQVHCHQHAVMGFRSDRKVLERLGIEADILDSGCCGMAGSFGFERGDKYEVSMKAGERVLLPAVGGASAETLVLADGFSCREQILQGTGRRALHLAQLIQMAMAQADVDRIGTGPRPLGEPADGGPEHRAPEVSNSS